MFEFVVALGLALTLVTSLALYIRGRRQRAELARLRAQVETTTNMVTVLAGSSIPRQRAPDTPTRRRGHLRVVKGGLIALAGVVLGWLWDHRRATIAATLAAGAGLTVGLALDPDPAGLPPAERPPATDPPAAEPATPDPRSGTTRVLVRPEPEPEPLTNGQGGGQERARRVPPAEPSSTEPPSAPVPTPSPAPPEPTPDECLIRLNLDLLLDLELCVGRAS